MRYGLPFRAGLPQPWVSGSTMSIRRAVIHTAQRGYAAAIPPEPSPTAPATKPPSPTSSPPPQPPRGEWGRGIRRAIVVGLFGAGTYLLGSFYPPESILLLYPRPAPPLPLGEGDEARAYAARLDQEVLALPHVRHVLAEQSRVKAALPGQEDLVGQLRRHYVLSRPFINLPQHMLSHSLTAGSLRKPGMLAVAPVVASKTRHGATTLGGHQGDAFSFIHLGRSLCGHAGIVHGGMLATLLDETLARTAFFHLPHKVGVTARLELDYKRPVRADTVVVIESKLIEHQGRKAWVEGTMRDLRGQVLVQSRALFVEPKMVGWLDTSAVQSALDQSDE